MGLRITEDVLYYAENNEWKPLPVIKGEKGDNGTNGTNGDPGDDAYVTWLKANELYPESTYHEYWQQYLQEHSRVPVPGASRVVKEGNDYVAYTPKLQSGATTGLPSTDANFVPYDGTTASCDRIVIPSGSGSTSSNINYQPLNQDIDYPISFLPSATVSSGGLVSKIGYMTNPKWATFNPSKHSLCVGNKGAISTVGSRIYISSYRGDKGASTGINAYADPEKVVGVVHLADDKDNNIEFGGASDGSCALGQTIIRAGAASFTDQLVDQATGTVTTQGPLIGNAVFIRRKPSNNKGWGDTKWQLFKNVDSGHVEHIKVPFKITPAKSFTQGRTYYPGTPNQVYNVNTIESLTSTWNYIASSNSGHSYDVIIQTNNKFNNPHIQYSVLGEEMAYTTPFADHFNIWGVKYDNSRGQLHFSISCKKSKSNFSNDYPVYDKSPVYVYIDFMLFTSDYK